MSLWDPAKGGSVENIIKTMVHRTLWCRRELSGGRGGGGGDPSRVFFNLRDFQHAWPSDPEKVLEIGSALSSLPPESRPQGIMFEDQNGRWVIYTNIGLYILSSSFWDHVRGPERKEGKERRGMTHTSHVAVCSVCVCGSMLGSDVRVMGVMGGNDHTL